jgi:hypothetical protein
VVRTAFHDHRNKPYSRRFPRPVDPEKIATAVIDALEHDRTRRTVPGWIEIAVAVRRRAPRLFDLGSRLFGGN